MTELQDYRAFRESAGAVELPRDFVRAAGPDVNSFLQGQLSQDVAALASGESARSLLLEPTGKVDGWFRVWGRSEEEVLIDLDVGAGAAVLERLNRFRLRVAAEFELLDWQLVAVRGPGTPPADAPAITAVGAELVTTTDWAGLPGLDLLGPSLALSEGIRAVDPAALEVLRIESGRPAMGPELGAELDPQVIPAEAGDWLIEQSVSFTKGCYTGQETVARLHFRGHTNRDLRGLVWHDAAPVTDISVVKDGKPVGTVRSVLASGDRTVALALLRREVGLGDVVTAAGRAATVVPLPFAETLLAG